MPPCAQSECERFTGQYENKSTVPPASQIFMVAIKPDKLPFLLRMFKTLVSPDSPLDLRELLEIFNRHVWFLMDPDNLAIQDLECGVSDFYQEPLVEELFVELWSEVNSQLNILDNNPVFQNLRIKAAQDIGQPLV